MKYIEEYLAQQVRIKVLGKLETIDEESEPCMPIGERIVIDDIETDIVIWHADYSKWLEKKYDQLQEQYNILDENYRNLTKDTI
jgi:hypothetical protein